MKTKNLNLPKMKKIIFLLFALLPFVGFSQSPTKGSGILYFAAKANMDAFTPGVKDSEFAYLQNDETFYRYSRDSVRWEKIVYSNPALRNYRNTDVLAATITNDFIKYDEVTYVVTAGSDAASEPTVLLPSASASLLGKTVVILVIKEDLSAYTPAIERTGQIWKGGVISNRYVPTPNQFVTLRPFAGNEGFYWGVEVDSLGAGTNTPLSVIIGEQRSSIPYDRGIYDAFPCIAWTGYRDTVFMVQKASLDHAADGTLWFAKTADGGTTWEESPVVISGDTVTSGVVTIGYSDGKIQLCYTSSVYDADVFFAYSDDNGVTFTPSDTITVPLQLLVSPHNKMINLPSGKLLFPAYSYNATVDSSEVFFYESTDGLNWTKGSSIMKTLMSGTFPTGGIIAEPAVEVVGGTTDGDTKMIAILNTYDGTARHYQLYSNDGGGTWTNTGANPFGSDLLPSIQGFPVSVIKSGPFLYTVIGWRASLSGGFQNVVYRANAEEVYDQSGQWGKYTIIYRAVTEYKNSGNDFGYPAAFLTMTGEMKVAFYDTSPKFRPGIDIVEATRIVVQPVRGNNYFESYNVSNQSIPNNTETVVLTPSIWYDSELYYNSDSIKIFIAEEGWYVYNISLTFDNSAAGSYRQAKLYMVDRGQEQNIIYPTETAFTLIAKETIPGHVSMADYNHIELSGQQFCYKGTQIRLTVKQDSGSSLNLINTAKENRATIKLKKIN